MRRPPDPDLPRVVSRATARTAGMTDRQISHRVARQDWTVLRRGLFLTSGGRPSGTDLAEVELRAAIGSTGRDLVVSHGHAARLWGLPEPLGGWGVPTFLTDGGPDRTRRELTIRASPFAEEEVVVLGSGVRVTSPTRTVLDCLRTLSPANGLAIADATARQLVAADDLEAAVAEFGGWPGVRKARRLVALVDGRRETPLASWSAVAFDDEQLPAPTWQVDVRDSRGSFVGRVDAWWAGGLAGEADGRAKYRLRAEERGDADAERLAQVLTEERDRQKYLERAGADVVRWGSDDVLRPARTIALGGHLRRLLARPGRTFTGTAAPSPVALPVCTRKASSGRPSMCREGG